MGFGAAIAGPLTAGARVGLQLPHAGPCAAQVMACSGADLVLELLDEIPAGGLEEGSVVDLLLPLSWGMYKWIALVSAPPSEKKAELQLLDAPMFIQRRLDPRVGVGVPAEVRHVASGRRGEPHQAIVSDLSRGGLKLEGARQLRAGDVVEITMDLSATLADQVGPLTLLGRVVMAYRSPVSDDPSISDAHVSFLEEQDQAVQAVDHFVTQQLKCRWKA